MKRKIIFDIMIVLFTAVFATASDLPSFGLQTFSHKQSSNFKQDELLVCFNDPSPGQQPAGGVAVSGPRTKRSIRNIVSNDIVTGAVVDKEFDSVREGLAVVKLPEGSSVVDAFIRFNLSSNVRYAEPNYRYNLLGPASSMNTIMEVCKTIQASQTLETDETQSVTVAIADTGIDYNHPLLTSSVWVNKAELDGAPNIDDDGNGYIDDIYGYDFAGAIASNYTDSDSDPLDTHYHGTHIAGIINNIGNNSDNNTKINLMALKIFADDYSLDPSVFVSDAVEAIGYAANNGAKIINASWGGGTYSQVLYDSIKDAGEKGLLVVAAAGNGFGNDNDLEPVYPASFDLDNVISVMSVNEDNELSSFSNYGPSSVDIAAPGENISSTTPSYLTAAMLADNISADENTLSGTSTSAANVSAQCAVIMAKNPTLSSLAVKSLLLSTADSIFASPRLNLSGGTVNLEQALMGAPYSSSGKILNTRYSPEDAEHLYNSIQSAIDDANDGDILIVEAGKSYRETIDFKGKKITLRSGNINDPNDNEISPETTFISGEMNPGTSVVTFHNNEDSNTIIQGFTIGWGTATYGGGISCENSSPTILDCIITNNTAGDYGGGIDCFYASPTIKDCEIVNNTTSNAAGIGAGINCDHSSPEIINCKISYNFAENIGSAIVCYYSDATITNCLITNNTSTYHNGNIYLEYSSPIISNCTIVTDSPTIAKDGGIHAYFDSSPTITNCIIWGNGDDLKNCIATFSCVEDGDTGLGNTKSNPMFLDGPLGSYYLTQIAAGQLVNSPCVNTGNPTINSYLQSSEYTTATDAIIDEDPIDMGYHYTSMPAPLVQLTVQEVREINGVLVVITPDMEGYSFGKIDPNGGTYRKQEVVQLTAIPDPNNKLLRWIGTDNDSITSVNNTITMTGNKTVQAEFKVIPLYRLRTEVIGGEGTLDPMYKRGQYFQEGTVINLTATPEGNFIVDTWSGTDDDTIWTKKNTVTMDSDKFVTVSFRQPRTVLVPGEFNSISQAIQAVYDHGDKVIVGPGTYSSINFNGKAVTVTSVHPDDPTCIATTIIDGHGLNKCVVFDSGEGRDSVLNGFTLRNGNAYDTWSRLPGDRNEGAIGSDAFGAGITCLEGASPTLSNLIIEDCLAHGQVGEPGTRAAQGHRDPQALQTPDPLDQADDPNAPEDPNDPNAVVDGLDGANGADGTPGPNGVDGADGADAYDGGSGGNAWGAGIYFDANSSPLLLNILIRDCNAIGGDGGRGGDGQDGQAGQDGAAGQDGQQGQNGGEGIGDDAAVGEGGDGGTGGKGGDGGDGGNGGNGGKGGEGGSAIGGGIYFGPNCRPVLRYVQIENCSTEMGLGSRGGDAGAGGNGGTGGAGGAGGAGGEGGADGEDGDGEPNEAGKRGVGGNGGDGGIGGDYGPNGQYAIGAAIYFGVNCVAEMENCIFTSNAIQVEDVNEYFAGGDGGTGGNAGRYIPEEGNGQGNQGNQGDDEEEEDDPNETAGTPGDGGDGGDGYPNGSGGNAGTGGPPVDEDDPNNTVVEPNDGEPGNGTYRNTISYGGSNYYDANCVISLKNCTFESSITDGYYGGAEYYSPNCSVTVTDCKYINNTSFYCGGAQSFSDGSTMTFRGTEYINNFITEYIEVHNYPSYPDEIVRVHHDNSKGGAIYWTTNCDVIMDDCTFTGQHVGNYLSRGGAVFAGGSETSGGYIYIYDDLGYLIDEVYEYGYDNSGSLSLTNSVFEDNYAQLGGAMFWYGTNANTRIDNCIFNENTSQEAGALCWFEGAPNISNCEITNNIAYGPTYTEMVPQLPVDINDPNTWYEGFDPNDPNTFYIPGDANSLLNPPDIEETFTSPTGGGGGIICWSSDALIEDCLISGNESLGSAGGIFFGGSPNSPTLKNCLVIDNKALIDGGGITSYWHAAPVIMNCTIANNVAFDPNREERGKGGGISCSYESSTKLINSILWGNSSRIGTQISIGSINDPRYLEYPATLRVSYCDVEGGEAAADVEPGRTLIWDNTNINADPLFIDPYVLSQTSAGESLNSPCVDAGSDISANFGLEMYSTRTDGGYDTGIIDMGYHSFNAVRYHLSASVPSGNGTISPTDRMYIAGQIAHVVAAPSNPNLFVRGWYNNGQLISTEKELDVVMNSDKNITVEFGTGKLINVSGGGNGIAQAYATASSGDTILVGQGTYNLGLELKKDIRIISTNPDDPEIVAQTIINASGGRAFTISDNMTSNTVIDGFTINGGGIYIGSNSNPVLANLVINNANVSSENGGAIYIGTNSNPSMANIEINNCSASNGGGIYVDQGANPTMSDITISGCSASGGNAGGIYMSSPANKTYTDLLISNCSASNGGAVYCGPGASPLFMYCDFSNNSASSSGGGLYYTSSSLATLINCNIEDNRAQNGAGIYAGSNNISILDNCSINSNRANALGGAVYYSSGCVSEVNDCNFYENYAASLGGALNYSQNSTFNVSNCEFLNNAAGSGGSIYFSAFSSGTLSDSILNSNNADNDGGAIYLIDSNDVIIAGCDISSNKSVRGAGIFAMDSTDSIITDCTLSDNDVNKVVIVTATHYHIPDPSWEPDPNDPNATAPLIEISPDDPNFDASDPNLVITEDTAKTGTALGGGIWSFCGPTTISNCQIRNNGSEVSGAGIYLAGNERIRTILDNCLIVNNRASHDGGGISNNWLNKLTVSNCTISENSTTGDTGKGGGIFNSYESDMKIINSIIWGNSASYDGSQISLGSGDEPYPIPATMEITYSDIEPMPEVIPGPNKLDIVFIVDTTGSMGSYINAMKDAAKEITGLIADSLPDFRIGVIEYQDFNDADFSYGAPTDAPYIDRSTFTNNINKAIKGINDIGSGSGADGPESNLAAIMHAIDHDRLMQDMNNVTHGASPSDKGPGSWRIGDDVERAIILMTDAVPHTPTEPFTEYTSETIIEAATTGPAPIKIFGIWNGTSSETQEALLELSDGTGGITIPASTSAEVAKAFTQVINLLARVAPMIEVEEGLTLPGWDPETETWDPSTHNIELDPMFAVDFFLSQLSSGQDVNSPCLDAGSGFVNDPEISLDSYTTSMDGTLDTGIVDMGYHHSKGLEKYNLSIETEGPGTVNPDGGIFYDGTELTLIATPSFAYRVQGWYDEEGHLMSTEKELDITITSDRVIKVIFELTTVTNVTGGGDTLITAIDNARTGDILVVGAGTYTGGIELGTKDITIVSTNPDDPDIVASTIIDCNNSRGITFRDNSTANVTISGFTIINGNSDTEHGGGILVGIGTSPTIRNVVIRSCTTLSNAGGIYISNDSSPTLIYVTVDDCSAEGDGGAVLCATNTKPVFKNCTFTNCTATNGGAVYFGLNSESIFEDCTITANTATNGGGLAIESICTVTATDCNISDNIASLGGGFYADNSAHIQINDSLIRGNTADIDGGAGYWLGAFVELNNCKIEYNTAIRGGGLWYNESPVTEIIGCTIFNNLAGPDVDIIDPNDPNATEVDPNDPNSLLPGQGGGIYNFSTEATIMDCIIKNNRAVTSGGGIYIAGDSKTPLIINNLITSNLAGRDGGGISVNWQSTPLISSCTFASNTAPGTYANANGRGYGGALYCSYHAVCTVTNSIFWNNYALRGPEIAVATGFEYDPRPSTLFISYCDIKPSGTSIWVDTGCELNPGRTEDTHNINKDPLFVITPKGSFFLSQTISGQGLNSPCVDAGSDDLNLLGIARFIYTTRTDEGPDMGTVDIGFHYPSAQPDKIFDLHTDGTIDVNDVEDFNDILNSGEACSAANSWCYGADFNFDGVVDENDVAFMNAYMWLGAEDDIAPIPNPSLWAVEPHSLGTAVSMSAQEAMDSWFDYWGMDVEYYFDCVYGDCHDSGWITSKDYTDSGLETSVEYAYRYRTRDAFPGIPDDGTGEPGNKTDWSSTVYVGTLDNTPPAPVPAIIDFTADTNAISLVASVAYDISGPVEYYFESLSTALGGHDSGWIVEPNYTDPNLTPNTEYGYRVRARDQRGNITIWSDPIYIFTLEPEDKTPPTPNPMTWDEEADANGLPHEVETEDANHPGYYESSMTATTAEDDESDTIYYYFQCVTDSHFDSGWITENTYSVLIGRSGLRYKFRVMAKDDAGNTTGWSSTVATIPYTALEEDNTE